jgi:hypothetical protein
MRIFSSFVIFIFYPFNFLELDVKLSKTLFCFSLCREHFDMDDTTNNYSAYVWDQISWQARRCIEMMLTMDPEERPSAQELLHCSWFNASDRAQCSVAPPFLLRNIVSQ